MKMEILKERDTPLLSRKRVSLMANYEGPTPSRMDFLKEVSKLVDTEPDLIIIKHVYTRFGRQKAKIIAHVYSDKKEMMKLEDEYLLKKHVKKEKKEEATQADAAAKDTAAKVEATEAPKEEAKVEEKKEEAPKEEKPEEKKEEPKEEKKEEAKPEEKPAKKSEEGE